MATTQSTTEPSSTSQLDPNWRDHTTLTITQVGEVLGISRNSAYRAAKSGDIPVMVIGGRMVSPTAKIRRLLGEVPESK